MKAETNNKIRCSHKNVKGKWFDLNDKNLEMLCKVTSQLNGLSKSLDYRVEYKFPVDRELEV